MERIGEDKGLTKRYPVDFPLFQIGYKLSIKDGLKDEPAYYMITNRGRLPKLQKYDSNWLISPDTTKSLGDMSEWLETDDKKSIYAVALGFRSDRELDIEFSMPQSEDLYTSKSQHTIKLSPSDSPHDKPNIWFWTKGDQYVPSLKIENNTEYTPNTFEIVGRGYKYRIEGLDGKPRNYHPVVLSRIGGSL